MSEEARCLLWLLSVFGVGSTKVWEVLRHEPDPQKACESLQDPEMRKNMHLTDRQLRRIAETTWDKVEKTMTQCAHLGISLLCYGDAAYPEPLQFLQNPPALLYYRGDISLLQSGMLLTVIGTRDITEYSLKVEKALCDPLVEAGFILVTGFAVGADIAANICALNAGRPSVAVMGCGLDMRYPNHYKLRDKIAENGLILSEYPPGTPPSPSTFPMRNRILAALSMGTLVIQAPERSGTSITAEWVSELGRDLFCVPPADLFDNRYAGVIKYLRDGATPVFSFRDIVVAYYLGQAHKIDTMSLAKYLDFPKSQSLVMDERERRKPAAKKKAEQRTEVSAASCEESAQATAENSASSDKKTAQAPPPLLPQEDGLPPLGIELDDEKQTILDLMQKYQTMHLDRLAEESGIPIGRLLSHVTELELMQRIARMPGKRFRLL